MPAKITMRNKSREHGASGTCGLEALSCLLELKPVSRVRICLLKFFSAVSAIELEVIMNSYKYQMKVLV